MLSWGTRLPKLVTYCKQFLRMNVWAVQYDTNVLKGTTMLGHQPHTILVHGSFGLTMIITAFIDWNSIVYNEFLPIYRFRNLECWDICGKLWGQKYAQSKSGYCTTTTSPPCILHPSFAIFARKIAMTVVLQAPYSSDMFQTDLFLFTKIKTPMKGERSVIVEAIRKNRWRSLRALG